MTRLIVLAGPTAVGKGTIVAALRAKRATCGCRCRRRRGRPRPGEEDGVDYFFVTDDEFTRMIDAGELLEWAVVHGGHRYGTPRRAVEERLADGQSVVLEIDLQGARQVKQTMPEALFVFVAPPSWEELVERLEGRGTEDPEERERRLAHRARGARGGRASST